MELKRTSQTKKVKNKYKIDDEPFRMNDFEWRGTLNNGDLSLVIKFNTGAWKIKYAETEYELNNISFMYVAQEISPMKYMIAPNSIDVNKLIKYLQWN